MSYAALYTYFNAFYMTFITITTVGYGDISPKTIQGRVIMMVATLIGTLLISMIVLASTTYLNLDKK
jgi:voltage-gated potassium channel